MQKHPVRSCAGSAPIQGCGGVRRSSSRQAATAARASSACSTTRRHGPSQSHVSSALPGGWSTAGGGRPGSAREWVERCQQRRSQEEVKKQAWDAASNQFKAAQFHVNFFNSHPSAPRCYSSPQVSEAGEEASRRIRVKCTSLDPPSPPPANAEDAATAHAGKDHQTDNQANVLTHKSYRTLLEPSELIRPEIAALKERLEELRARNAEERSRLNEELSYRAWQNSSVDARKLESERLQEFVRSAWLDQRGWREQERMKREQEELRIEKEAEEIRRREEAKERRLAEQKQEKREQYQKELEQQLQFMRREASERAELSVLAEKLSAERSRLLTAADNRQQLLAARKHRSLAKCWLRQHHLKLIQRSAQVMRDIAEDQSVVQQLQQHRSSAAASEQGNELQWLQNVLDEHKKLEQQRAKEYEFLFSEEAERLWQRREEQWQQEEQARQALLQEVLDGRQQQLQQNLTAKQEAEDKLEAEGLDVAEKVARVEEQLVRLEQGCAVGDDDTAITSVAGVATAGGDDIDCLNNNNVVGRILNAGASAVSFSSPEGENSKTEGPLNEAAEETHRKEIARLETEMARLWGPLYQQPHYGRKKMEW
uniref:Trichoplein keratin filament-binding protein-like n=1 Tax=Hirondellea gigas TaxID=1518452 RepID=A0A2P2HXD7_9CRUS